MITSAKMNKQESTMKTLAGSKKGTNSDNVYMHCCFVVSTPDFLIRAIAIKLACASTLRCEQVGSELRTWLNANTLRARARQKRGRLNINIRLRWLKSRIKRAEDFLADWKPEVQEAKTIHRATTELAAAAALPQASRDIHPSYDVALALRNSISIKTTDGEIMKNRERIEREKKSERKRNKCEEGIL
jgi:hypothetical protein